jgi:hypothetical protein
MKFDCEPLSRRARHWVKFPALSCTCTSAVDKMTLIGKVVLEFSTFTSLLISPNCSDVSLCNNVLCVLLPHTRQQPPLQLSESWFVLKARVYLKEISNLMYTVGPLFTNLYFGQTGQTNRETQVP